MHILIDIQGCQSGSRFRGIGRSVLAMSRAIIQNKGDYRVSILLNGMYPLDIIDETRQSFIDILPLEEMFIFSSVGPIGYIDKKNHSRNALAAEIRDVAIANISPDVVLVTGFFEGYWDEYITSVPEKTVPWKTVCVCHDLIPLLNQSFYFSDKLFGKWYLEKLANYQKSDAILAISHSSLNEMIEYTDYPKEKLFYISSGVGEQFQIYQYSAEQKAHLQSTYNIPEYFIMSLAMEEPRKNIASLIKAYGQLDPDIRNKYPLVLAYKINDDDLHKFRRLANEFKISKEQLIFTGYLPDDDLIALYNLCTLFIFPSLHEGFGLPPLEAMKCGAATLGSNTTSLPEVIGWEEATFDPTDISDIGGKILRALTDQDFYQQLKAHAITQSAKFTWKNTAELVLASIDSLFSQPLTYHASYDFSVAAFTESVIGDINHYQDIDKKARLDYAWALSQNSFLAHRRKLLVDISELVQRDDKSGIQRVSRSILYEFLNRDIPSYDVRAVYYVNGECYRYANEFVRQNYGMDFGSDEPVLFSKDDIMLVTDLTISFFPFVLPSIDTARRAGCHIYFIVYDILPIKFPEWSSEGIQQLFPTWLQSITTYGSGVICISASVADDVHQWIKDNQHLKLNKCLTVSHFYLGGNLESSKPTRGIPVDGVKLLAELENCHGFLMVGTLEPRKGHEQVLSAFDMLWAEDKDYLLVIVGKHGWNVDELTQRIIKHPQLNKRLFWLQGVSDEYLEMLYQSTRALIFASRGEGFGLPLIEAAQKALPLILRDIPVFREIAGDNAWYFSGEGGGIICDTIKEWLTLYERNSVPDSTNISWLNWQESAEVLLRQLPLIKHCKTS